MVLQKSIKWYPRKKKGRYYGPFVHKPESLLFDTLPLLIKSWAKRWHYKQCDVTSWMQKESVIDRSQSLVITWIGHATFLIQLAGKNILTDPVFSHVSPLFQRLTPAGISIHSLPPIDYVLLSHNHWDHMDTNSLLQLKKHYPTSAIYVPDGNKQWFIDRGFTAVTEHTWWDTVTSGSLSFTFLPAVHWSGRRLFDTNRSLWGSWMIRNSNTNETIYFAGDTAIGDHFNQIAREFSSIDCSLLPVGPCEPHDWMKRTHMNGAQALTAFHQLNARHFIPMHWGTFPFGYDQFDEPLHLLARAWLAQENKDQKIFHILKIGQQWHLDQKEWQSAVFFNQFICKIKNQ